ncbi:hypothetical protein NDA11_005527 [Ustilago hordei]|nr:hypothetical protein NDA11_005527 [Ustilago hordei]
MASGSALAELWQPTTLVSHPSPVPAELARHAALAATAFSTTKNSTVSVGESYKISSDSRALRRVKGPLPIILAGNALNLVQPESQRLIQSFPLSSAEVASCAPLTLLRSIPGSPCLRTTYVAIQSHTPAKSRTAAVTATHQLRAYVEQLSAKGKESVEVHVRKESLSLSQPVRLIHALADGRLVLTHPDDSLSILASFPIISDDQASISDAPSTALQLIHTLDATQSQPQQQRCHLYVNLLDARSAKHLIARSSKIEQAALLALRVAVTSHSSITDDHASSISKKKKRSKRSKNDSSSKDGPVGDADQDEAALAGSATPALGVPSGPLTLELTAFVKSFDGAVQSAISTVKLGSITVPSVSNAKHVLDVQLHPHGRLVILTIHGHLTSLTLGTCSSSEPVLSNINTISMPALAPASNARPCSSSSASASCCLLISKDHLLVLAIAQATPATADKERLVALILDLELNAVLRQIDWPVPFLPLTSHNPASSGWLQRMTSISASRIAGSTSLITIGPPTVSPPSSHSSSDKAQALAQLLQRRTCVLSLPFAVPERSVLRDALGKGELTLRWIHNAQAAAAAQASSSSDASRSELLEQIKTITAQNKARASSKDKDMNAAITTYIEAATADRGMLETLPWPQADTKFYGELLDLVLPAPSQHPSKRSSAAPSARFFERSALLTLLKDSRVDPSIFATLRPNANANANANASALGPVSVEVNGARLSAFWSRLAAHNDAQVIRAALKRIPDVGEDSLVSLVTSALRGLVQSRKSGNADPFKAAQQSMALLAQLVQLRVSRPALRSALKVQLRDHVDQVMALLQICNAWISQTIQFPFQAKEKPEVKETAVNGQAKDDDRFAPAKAPNADAVIAFANDVLDALFPLLLVTPRSHSTVRSLSATISRYLELMSTLSLLNAPLSALAKLQQENDLFAAKAANAANAAKYKQSKTQGTTLSASGAVASAGNAKVSPLSRRDTSARAEMGGALGLKLGTQGEQKTRRLQFLQQSMLVGAYSFERMEV